MPLGGPYSMNFFVAIIIIGLKGQAFIFSIIFPPSTWFYAMWMYMYMYVLFWVGNNSSCTYSFADRFPRYLSMFRWVEDLETRRSDRVVEAYVYLFRLHQYLQNTPGCCASKYTQGIATSVRRRLIDTLESRYDTCRGVFPAWQEERIYLHPRTELQSSIQACEGVVQVRKELSCLIYPFNLITDLTATTRLPINMRLETLASSCLSVDMLNRICSVYSI